MSRPLFGRQGSADEADVEVSFDDFKMIFGIWKSLPMKIANFVMSVIAGVVGIAQNIVMGYMMSDMTMSMMPDSTLSFDDVIIDMVLKMLYCIIAQLVVMGVSMGIRITCIPSISADLRGTLYASMMNQDIEFFDQNQTGVLVSRIAEDSTLIVTTYFDKVFQIVQNAAQTIANMIVSFIFSWRVTLVCFPIIPLSGVTFIVGECFVNKLWVTYNETSTAAADKAEEIITSFRIVKSFDREMSEADKYEAQLSNVNTVYKRTSVVDGAKSGIISFLMQGMMAIIFYYSFWIMFRRPQWGLESGDMIITMMSVMQSTMGVTSILAIYTDFRKAAISAAKISAILKTKPKTDRKQGNTLENVEGKLEFRDVCFKYNGRDDYAVKNLTFTVEAGQTVAFVGESGCGKSTTLQLIQRFYEIESGEILLDGVDIRTLSQVFLRSQISIVPQGPVLFSMSIFDNIRYARPDSTQEEVAAAARIGNAHDFIMELPENYETTVGQTSLSGGQKQRICISRSIVQSTPILLLDEATAALDTESEQLVQQSIETFRHGHTAIMVAHRLATVKNADIIFVFKDGTIAEQGSFDALMKSGGLFADLVKYQLQ